MKKLKLILLLFTLFVFITACDKEEFEEADLSNQNDRQLNLENDIVYDGLSDKKMDDFSSKSQARNFSYQDSDNDGIADYAESNIENLDPNRYDDILSMEPSTILTISTIDGIQEIPLYQTSYYQEKMLEIHISSFRSSDPWTDIQKERIRYYFSAVKKIWLTPEWRNYVYNKFGSNKADSYFRKFKTVKRNVQFRHCNNNNNNNNISGISNNWNYIGIVPWVMSNHHYQRKLPKAMSHELVHHLGFGHNGIPYGTAGQARRMISSGKADYPIFDINKKTNYIEPCIPMSASNNNNYHSIHNLKIPNTGIDIKRHWRGDYEVYDTPISFNSGDSYESTTRFLNGGKYSIWIDFNDDAVFDNSEQLLNNVRTEGGRKVAKYNFSIPENANKGVHRLRIVKSTYHSVQACRYVNGQAIDFTNVTIQ